MSLIPQQITLSSSHLFINTSYRRVDVHEHHHQQVQDSANNPHNPKQVIRINGVSRDVGINPPRSRSLNERQTCSVRAHVSFWFQM